MERVPLFCHSHPVGELTACQNGKDTCFTAQFCQDEKTLWCLWAVGSSGEVRLGIPQEGHLTRCFSSRMTAPMGQLLRGELRPAAPPVERWEAVQNPEERFHTPWLCRALAGQKGVLMTQVDGVRRLALPFSREMPFPLPPLFCLACIRCIRGREYAVFSFDQSEWPVFYRGGGNGGNGT